MTCITLIVNGCKTTNSQKQTKLQSTPQVDPNESICAFPSYAMMEASLGREIASSSSATASVATAGAVSSQSNISWRTLMTTVVASRLAYRSKSEVSIQLKRYGYPLVEHIEEGPIYGFIAVNKENGCMIISFRGSDDIRDWFSNIRMMQATVQKGKIHSGFKETYQAINNKIQRLLRFHSQGINNLWVTGHSLGGALAGLFAYEQSIKNEMNKSTLRINRLITYGQPMFADERLANYFTSTYGARYLRVVHGRDIITRVPKGYVHSGDLLWFHDGIADFRPNFASRGQIATASASTASGGSQPESGVMSDESDAPVAPNTPDDLLPNDQEFDALMNLDKLIIVEEPKPQSRDLPRSTSESGVDSGPQPESAVATASTASFFVPTPAEDHRLIYYIESVQENKQNLN
ncbi:MAG: lipase family protein [Proteobacteria bacterium]|nr:lipase family protein [Pseudomonadota bacterium]